MGWFSKKSQKSSLEDAARKLHADAQVAETILTAYGGVLEATSKMNYGAPRSSLPKPIEEIKRAILTRVLYLHLTKALDKREVGLMQVVYAKLAFFFDDEDARIAVAASGAISTAPTDLGTLSKEQIQAIASRFAAPEFDAAIKRHAKAAEEFKSLCREFNTAVAKFGVQV
jgi:hypothetical protein